MTIKVLELYSGIGGMHYGLKLSGLDAQVVAAVDINPHANMVYKHNFKDTNVIQKTIEGIKLEAFDELDFDMVLMSPPCQPFTRQGNQNGSNDNRAQSFLTFIQILPQLAKKPKYLLVENVKGFDQDEARTLFLDMLKSNGYHYQEFLLSPIQFGIPNSRLRYFLIAKLNEPFIFDCQSEILTKFPAKIEPALRAWLDEINKNLVFDQTYLDSLVNLGQPSQNEQQSNDQGFDSSTIETVSMRLNQDYRDCVNSSEDYLLSKNVRNLGEFVSNSVGTDSALSMNDESFMKSLNALDIVTCASTRSNCFTKNYGRKTEGTGSILAIVPFVDSSNSIQVDKKLLRFFSPKEISNLHCFPASFEYPDELTTKQKWRLIGNSLNVLIVAMLIKLMTTANNDSTN